VQKTDVDRAEEIARILGADGKFDQAGILETQRIRYERVRSAGANKLILDLMVNEMTGGKCPHCGKPWKKIVVKNQFADYEYFDPNCECYQRCDSCGMSLHGVTLPNKAYERYHCPRCGYPGVEKWILLCTVCAQNAEKHEGKYFRYVCSDCRAKDRKRKDYALER